MSEKAVKSIGKKDSLHMRAQKLAQAQKDARKIAGYVRAHYLTSANERSR